MPKSKRVCKRSHEIETIERALRGNFSIQECLIEINICLDLIPIRTKASTQNLAALERELRESPNPNAPYVVMLLTLLRLGYMPKDGEENKSDTEPTRASQSV